MGRGTVQCSAQLLVLSEHLLVWNKIFSSDLNHLTWGPVISYSWIHQAKWILHFCHMHNKLHREFMPALIHCALVSEANRPRNSWIRLARSRFLACSIHHSRWPTRDSAYLFVIFYKKKWDLFTESRQLVEDKGFLKVMPQTTPLLFQFGDLFRKIK